MFERSYFWAMRRGPRLLLMAALLLLVTGIWRFGRIMTFDGSIFGTPEYFFLMSVGPATILLAGAVVTDRLGGRQTRTRANAGGIAARLPQSGHE